MSIDIAQIEWTVPKGPLGSKDGIVTGTCGDALWSLWPETGSSGTVGVHLDLDPSSAAFAAVLEQRFGRDRGNSPDPAWGSLATEVIRGREVGHAHGIDGAKAVVAMLIGFARGHGPEVPADQVLAAAMGKPKSTRVHQQPGRMATLTKWSSRGSQETFSLWREGRDINLDYQARGATTLYNLLLLKPMVVGHAVPDRRQQQRTAPPSHDERPRRLEPASKEGRRQDPRHGKRRLQSRTSHQNERSSDRRHLRAAAHRRLPEHQEHRRRTGLGGERRTGPSNPDAARTKNQMTTQQTPGSRTAALGFFLTHDTAPKTGRPREHPQRSEGPCPTRAAGR